MNSIIKIAIIAVAANAIKGFKDTEKAASGMGDKVTKSTSRLGGMVAGAVGISTVASAFKLGADEAQKFQDATNQTNQALATNTNLGNLNARTVQANSAAIETLTG